MQHSTESSGDHADSASFHITDAQSLVPGKLRKQNSSQPSEDHADSAGFNITHAQPLVPGQEAGTFVAQPLLTPVEAEIEANLGLEDSYMKFGALDEIALGLYTHRLTVTSGPEHLCRHYLVRLAR